MKDFFLKNKEIQFLIDEPKPVDCSPESILLGMEAKGGRASSILQNSCKFPRQDGEGEWLIYLRSNMENPLDFSCGLGLIPKGRAVTFHLRRYNGKSHEHTNWLEKEPTFYDFHIHEATERYQNSSYKDDHYAKVTDRYAQLDDAFRCLLEDLKVTGDSSGQLRMF